LHHDEAEWRVALQLDVVLRKVPFFIFSILICLLLPKAIVPLVTVIVPLSTSILVFFIFLTPLPLFISIILTPFFTLTVIPRPIIFLSLLFPIALLFSDSIFLLIPYFCFEQLPFAIFVSALTVPSNVLILFSFFFRSPVVL